MFLKNVQAGTFTIGVLACLLLRVPILAQCPPDDLGSHPSSNAQAVPGIFDALRQQIGGAESTLRAQERMLLNLQQEQCAKERGAPPEQVPRGREAVTPLVVLPVWFLTDRQPISAPMGRHAYFGSGRQMAGVTYGRITIRMPAENYLLRSTVPEGESIQTEIDSQSGVSVDPPEILSNEQFNRSLRAYKAALPQGAVFRVVIFINGFNVTFPEAAEAAARLAFGLRINVLPIVISWPSQGDILKYFNDEQNIEPSIERLRSIVQFLLRNQDVDEIDIVAHSMGCRLITRILSQLALENVQTPKLTRVALAAADLNEAEFRELWPRIKQLPSKGWLFYTSGNDIALEASALLHSVPPIGNSKTRIFTIVDADTVDASAVAPQLRGYGHSYVIDNPNLSADLSQWISKGLTPSQRSLIEGNRPPAVFWEFQSNPTASK